MKGRFREEEKKNPGEGISTEIAAKGGKGKGMPCRLCLLLPSTLCWAKLPHGTTTTTLGRKDIYILLLVPLLHEPLLPPFLSKHARTISTMTPPHFLGRKRERRRRFQRMENLVWWRPQLTFFFFGGEGEEEGCLWGKAGDIVGRGKKKDIFPSSFFPSIAIFFFEAASSSRYPRRLLTHQRGEEEGVETVYVG